MQKFRRVIFAFFNGLFLFLGPQHLKMVLRCFFYLILTGIDGNDLTYLGNFSTRSYSEIRI